MTRLVIAILVIASCSGSGKQAKNPEPPPAKKIAVSWGIEKQGEMADISLATTDETGKQVSTPVGRYKGDCSVITPAKEMNALTGVACKTGGTGTELHAVVQGGDEVIILQLGINEGVTPDPMAREEVTRVKVPLGAKIEAGT